MSTMHATNHKTKDLQPLKRSKASNCCSIKHQSHTLLTLFYIVHHTILLHLKSLLSQANNNMLQYSTYILKVTEKAVSPRFIRRAF